MTNNQELGLALLGVAVIISLSRPRPVGDADADADNRVVWGLEPWKSALPKIMAEQASSANRTQPAKYVAAALMSDDTMIVRLSDKPITAMPGALVERLWKDGKAAGFTADPALDNHPVAEWLRG